MNGRDGVADEHGDVRIDGLVPGTYAVGVTCPNAASFEKYDPMVVGGDRALTGLVWKVTPGFAIRGRVTDEKGQPLAGASIEAGPSARGEPRGRLDFGEAKTQKDGTFAIRGLVGGTYRLEASHAAFATPDEALELTVGTISMT